MIAPPLLLTGGESTHPFPPVPTRDQVCRMKLTFQGLTVHSDEYDADLRYFEPAIMCLHTLEDRQRVYAAKHAAGDTHLIIELSATENPVYHSGQYADIPIIITNGELDLPLFLNRIEEILMNGFTPCVVFDGDEGDGEYGDPNARRQLQMLVPLLRGSAYGDLNQYVLYCRFWDGVFYGSSPENIASFGALFRSLVPHGYLAIEHNTAHIPVGGGAGDYAHDGPMAGYDVICSEFDVSNSTPPDETVWAIALRLLGPAWRCPPDAPQDYTTAYAISKWYLANGSPRGPYYAIAFEWVGAMDWVNGRSTADQEASRRRYFSALGYGDLTG